MLNGRVVKVGECLSAIVDNIEIAGTDGVSEMKTWIVDTGFHGYLKRAPSASAHYLSARMRTERFMMADGRTVPCPVYESSVMIGDVARHKIPTVVPKGGNSAGRVRPYESNLL